MAGDTHDMVANARRGRPGVAGGGSQASGMSLP